MQPSPLEDLYFIMCLEYQNLISKYFFPTEQRNHENYVSRFKCIVTYSILREF